MNEGPSTSKLWTTGNTQSHISTEGGMTEASAADRRDMDAEDTKKSKKDKWKNFFTPSNPDLWIALGVIAVVIILVCLFVVVVAVLCVLFVCVCIRKQKQRYSSNIIQHNK